MGTGGQMEDFDTNPTHFQASHPHHSDQLSGKPHHTSCGASWVCHAALCSGAHKGEDLIGNDALLVKIIGVHAPENIKEFIQGI